MKRNWSFTKHFTVFAVAFVFLDIILKWTFPNKSGISVGVISRPDETTAVYVSSRLPEISMIDISIIVVFIIVLILYNPIKRYIES